MKQLLSILSFVLFLCIATSANATTIGFESGEPAFFSYSGVVTGPGSSNPNSGYRSVLGFTGSSSLAFNPNEASPSSFISIGSKFDLNSFIVAGAWGNQDLLIKGYVDGVEAYSTTLGVTPQASRVTLNWVGLDSFELTVDSSGYEDTVEGGGGQHWAMDDVVVNEPVPVSDDAVPAPKDAVPVPEPGSMLMMGMGVFGLLMVRRRSTT